MSLQTTHDKSQAKLVDHSRQYDEEVAIKLAELDIVAVDLERANQKVSVLERDNEVLKRELSNFRGEAASGTWQDPALLSRKVKAQDAEISKLLTEVENYRQQVADKDATTSRRINELEREAAVRNLESAQTKEQLARYEDYEQVKKELHVMKLIQFSTNVSEAYDIDTDGLENTGDPNIDYSLEKLLMEKNKRFQGEITALKLSLEDATEQLARRTEELQDSISKSEAQAKLVSRLEEDVYKLNSIVASGGANASTSSALSPTPLTPLRSAIDDPILSITTPSPAVALGLSETGMLAPAASPPNLPTSKLTIQPLSPAPPSESSSTIVPILVNHGPPPGAIAMAPDAPFEKMQ
ncbi:hypothetical protein HDU67_009440 [Dinochytrium kinnereticum]|nr:hypothetical protein HDU67_009440 [Dinochytrium kinnereticum]